MRNQIDSTLLLVPFFGVCLLVYSLWIKLEALERVILFSGAGLFVLVFLAVYYWYFSAWGKANQKRKKLISEIPDALKSAHENSIRLGVDSNLEEVIFLPNLVRTRHVHILGATGSGKTESVVLNFIKQDLDRGVGSIILDAKGDGSFVQSLTKWTQEDSLQIFDLSSAESIPYNPLESGSPLEAAQRLFASLVWSEEYYQSKANSYLQRIFQKWHQLYGRNPTLKEISDTLSGPDLLGALLADHALSTSMLVREHQDLAGLRDQIRSLTLGHLEKTLSPGENEFSIQLDNLKPGQIIYFRLQSLMSPRLVSTVGRLIINHLSFIAGEAHRATSNGTSQFTPVYLDEFATFACPEFTDLISKARSAGFALHFSHQSIGDLTEVSPSFINRITDNSATKIVLRINDPDSAEFMARCFGTKEIQKTTQRITNAKDIEAAEIVGEGTTREAHQFKASPDLFKTLPTGCGAVLISHGLPAQGGAASVFNILFERTI